MTETRWLSEEEQQLWLEFRKFLWGFPSAMDRQLSRDSNMSTGEYSVLAAISDAAPGRLRSGDLASTLQWERSRVSHLLRRMETKGLLERHSATCDGRGQEIGLSEAGWETLRNAAPNHVTFVRETLFDALSEGEQAQLRSILGKVREAVIERDLW